MRIDVFPDDANQSGQAETHISEVVQKFTRETCPNVVHQ